MKRLRWADPRRTSRDDVVYFHADNCEQCVPTVRKLGKLWRGANVGTISAQLQEHYSTVSRAPVAPRSAPLQKPHCAARLRGCGNTGEVVALGPRPGLLPCLSGRRSSPTIPSPISAAASIARRCHNIIKRQPLAVASIPPLLRRRAACEPIYTTPDPHDRFFLFASAANHVNETNRHDTAHPTPFSGGALCRAHTVAAETHRRFAARHPRAAISGASFDLTSFYPRKRHRPFDGNPQHCMTLDS